MRTRSRRQITKPEHRDCRKAEAPLRLVRFTPVWAVALAACSALLAALVLVPAGFSWTELTTASIVTASSQAAVDGPRTMPSPFLMTLDFLKSVGVKPKRLPWASNGVDYGNTRISLKESSAQVCLVWQYRPKKLDAVPAGVNVLAPTWFYVEDNGETAEVNDLATLREGKIASWSPAQYIAKAHGSGAAVWAAVVSMNPDLSAQIVNDSQCQSAFIARIASWVQEYELDGINFDFEKMNPADKERFTALIANTKRALPAGVVVSVDVTVPLANPSSTNWWQCYDRAGLGRAADFVAVMAYDNPDMEPTAALDWVLGRVRTMLDMVPSEKILLGIPFYGVDFQFDVPAGGKVTEVPDYDKSKSRSTMSPANLELLVANQSYKSGKKTITVDYWIEKGIWMDTEGILRYSFVDTAGVLHVIYCEDGQSIELKGRLLTNERLGGAAVWRLEFGSNELWSALQQGMTAIR